LAAVLPRVFTADTAVAARATAAFALLAVAMVPAGIAMGLDGVLIGAADYRFLGRASVLEVVVVLPLLVVTLVCHPLGIVGVWTAYLVWRIARAVVNHQRVKGAGWQFSVP
jgi:Na+-driven multidrug efflux pump